MKSRNLWKITLPLAAALAALAFIPLIIPGGVAEPFLFGIPRTLWVSMAISLSIYLVLIIAMIFSKEK
ncbi:hypothetical protein [Candidatus Mycalebacterium sp.]